ncbi:MAG TPA: carboxypeptidase-like regulatory domain-containing protein, partial [Emticicia sp.]
MKLNFTLRSMLRGLVFFGILLGACAPKVWAQSRTITGKVTSKEDGMAMPGVNILLKGTQKGTSTNATGNYSIEVSGSNAVLVFSFVGYEATEVPVGNRSTVDLAMDLSSESLKEVVVTALGIKREEKSLGYSVGKVDGKDLSRISNENVLNAMSGKVAGVAINSTGATGSSVSMVIRGAKSLSNDNQ